MNDLEPVAPQPCPLCGHALDAASSVNSREPVRPKRGDLSVCIYCAGFMVVIDDEGRLGELTVEQIGNLPDEIRIQMQRIRRVIERRRPS